jgi:tRNA-2-methylthio-N6-dimethylallyladenosine synthase
VQNHDESKGYGTSGKSVYIRTFGCQMNVHDSEKMLGVLVKEGYTATDNPAEADLVIFNTCSIRQKAEQKFFSELGRMRSVKRKKPELMVAVAGCIAQQEGGKILGKAPHVDFIFGPQNLHILTDIASGVAPRVALDENPYIATRDIPAERGDTVRAWVTIMYGCNNFCSYCVVPYTRGREHSRPSEHILSEVSELARKGYKEITLLGQNVNSYASDVDFAGLLRMLNRVQGIQRIRFVTSHPKDLSVDLIHTMSGLDKVCEHIHLPLQSGSSDVLKVMNRGYTYDAYAEKVAQMRRGIPGISITSDIIAGFPGETNSDHLRTVEALKEMEFDGIFAFKFSPRPHTRAALMRSHVPEHIKDARLSEILTTQDDITLRKNRSIEGTFQEILSEGESETDPEKLMGRTRTNKIVTFAKNGTSKGTFLHVQITRGRKHSLEGIPIKT